MNPDALGRSIMDAIRFLQGIYKDIRSQIASMDRIMEAHGWVPMERNQVSWVLGNSLSSGKEWALDRLARAYTRSKNEAPVDRIVAFIWYLYADSDDAYQVPTCLAVAARFATAGTTHSVSLFTHEWDVGEIYTAVGRNPLPVKLQQSHFQSLFPEATSASALVLPICELTAEAVLCDRLLTPILQSEAAL